MDKHLLMLKLKLTITPFGSPVLEAISHDFSSPRFSKNDEL